MSNGFKIRDSLTRFGQLWYLNLLKFFVTILFMLFSFEIAKYETPFLQSFQFFLDFSFVVLTLDSCQKVYCYRNAIGRNRIAVDRLIYSKQCSKRRFLKNTIAELFPLWFQRSFELLTNNHSTFTLLFYL